MKYLDKDLTFIHNALVNNEVSSKELINEAINNINESENLNAFNLINENVSEKEITESILSGIPYALKDNISTKGIRTTACSNTLKNYVPVFNATVYENLENAGSIMIGKTNLDELAMGGTGTTGNAGIVKNPWDETRIAGGSSAGSAVSVAKGIVPYAIGTDTGDSIRKPAAYCGVVGYKPSYGLVSRYGLFAFASSLDHIGVFTRNVKDAAIVMNNMKSYDEKDMTSYDDSADFTEGLENSSQNKKLFYIKEILEEANDEIKDNFNMILDNAKKIGIEVFEESIDISLLRAIKPIYDCISCAEVTSNASNLTGILFGPRGKGEGVMDMMKDHRANGFCSLIKRRFVIGSFVLQKENQEKYFLNAKRVRRLLVKKLNELFKTYDGLILPCASGGAPLINKATNVISKNSEILENHLALGNFGGYPSITIPSGFIDSLPIAINITGAFKDDKNVLNIAYNLENTMNFKNQIAKGDN